MKKILSILLASLLVVSLAACGGGSGSSSSEAAPAASQDNTANENPGTDETPSSDFEWPVKTIEVVVHAAAGGDTDFNARTFAQYFTEITGVNMIITNMAGGGGSIATSHVKSSTNDGSIMLFSHSGPMVVNEVSGTIDYSFSDFDIVAIPAVDKGTVLVASTASGFTSYEDMVEKAKAEPGSVVYGTELGGYSHLQGLILQDKAGIEFKIVDTGSAADKIQNLLGGRIDVASIAYGSVQDYETTGELVILAQYSETPNAFLGDIPTFVQSGLDFGMDNPYVIAFPQGTDPAIIAAMNEVVEQIAGMDAYAQALEAGFKQPVTYYLGEDAVAELNAKRDLYMGYKDLLA